MSLKRVFTFNLNTKEGIIHYSFSYYSLKRNAVVEHY